MKNRMIKVAAVVPRLRCADPAYNTANIIAAMAKTKDCGLVVFPELCVTGYTCSDLFNQKILLEAALNSLKEIAEASLAYKGTTFAVGIPVAFGNDLYNCAAYVSQGKIAALIPKINVPTYGEFYEGRWFASGETIKNQTISIADQEVMFGCDILPFDEKSGAVIGTDICEDLWVPDKPSSSAALAGANILVNLSASDEIIGKASYRRNLVKQQSGDCYAGYVYVSAGPDESSTDLVFSGHTVIAANGIILRDVNFPQRPAITGALLDLEQTEYNRRHAGTFKTRLTQNYRFAPVSVKPVGGVYEISSARLASLLKKEKYEVSRLPFVPKDNDSLAERCRAILEIQANGLATRMRNTGIKTLVIGVSGGLDSTLALIVCHEAGKLVDHTHIISYTMPCEGNTSFETYKNAVNLMKALKTEIREIPIGPQVDAHLKALGRKGEYGGEGDTTYENAQARMRTYILMDAANAENGLVVGTGDLSELAMGWCTYNGDHMSMYGVNASVPKTLVRYICKAYALTCSERALKKTLLAIVDTPISPELTPSLNGSIAQKTEEKIGRYDLNDFFLYWLVRYGFEPDKILALALVAYPELSAKDIREALTRFIKRFFSQQFKRSCLPDGPKVGSVSLSPRGDWRMPSDIAADLWLMKLNKE